MVYDYARICIFYMMAVGTTLLLSLALFLLIHLKDNSLKNNSI